MRRSYSRRSTWPAKASTMRHCACPGLSALRSGHTFGPAWERRLPESRPIAGCSPADWRSVDPLCGNRFWRACEAVSCHPSDLYRLP